MAVFRVNRHPMPNGATPFVLFSCAPEDLIALATALRRGPVAGEVLRTRPVIDEHAYEVVSRQPFMITTSFVHSAELPPAPLIEYEDAPPPVVPPRAVDDEEITGVSPALGRGRRRV